MFVWKAINYANMTAQEKSAVVTEVNVLRVLSHPNIVKYIDYRWQPYKAKLYMEYCSKGNLQDFIRQSQKYANNIFLCN